jgi:hypothetical protein
VFGGTFGYCDHPKFVCGLYGGHAPLDGVEIGYDDGYEHFVMFGPDFGCIHFLQKAET